jgi:hypothetical protein
LDGLQQSRGLACPARACGWPLCDPPTPCKAHRPTSPLGIDDDDNNNNRLQNPTTTWWHGTAIFTAVTTPNGITLPFITTNLNHHKSKEKKKRRTFNIHTSTSVILSTTSRRKQVPTLHHRPLPASLTLVLRARH